MVFYSNVARLSAHILVWQEKEGNVFSEVEFILHLDYNRSYTNYISYKTKISQTMLTYNKGIILMLSCYGANDLEPITLLQFFNL